MRIEVHDECSECYWYGEAEVEAIRMTPRSLLSLELNEVWFWLRCKLCGCAFQSHVLRTKEHQNDSE